MWKITNNLRCYITKDGEHFAVEDILNNTVDGGYRLGKFAIAKDGAKRYRVTINENEIFEMQELAEDN